MSLRLYVAERNGLTKMGTIGLPSYKQEQASEQP